MNSGEAIMFDLKPELYNLIQCRSPATKKDIMMAFNKFCNHHDLVDLVGNFITVKMHKGLRELFGVDFMEPHNLFKYINGLITPFSV